LSPSLQQPGFLPAATSEFNIYARRIFHPLHSNFTFRRDLQLRMPFHKITRASASDFSIRNIPV
jgi:hypothetical protein